MRKIVALLVVVVVCGAAPAMAIPGVDWVTEKLLGTAWDYFTRTPLDEMKEKAEKGDAQAQYTLGLMYYEGKEVSKNYPEALKWIRRAAEEQEYVDAQFFLGYMYYEGIGTPQNYSEAARWTRKAAEQGHATAQYNLGHMYEKGEGVKQDKEEAKKWYRKSNEQKLAVIKRNLRQDNSEAGRWLRPLARKGDPDAQAVMRILGETW